MAAKTPRLLTNAAAPLFERNQPSNWAKRPLPSHALASTDGQRLAGPKAVDAPPSCYHFLFPPPPYAQFEDALDIDTATATQLASKPLNISQELVDPNAMDVVAKLKQAGYQAWLVGGCVRDLLLGTSPKDFDVATNATPEQVRSLFRRSRMVGRRFKIAHVRYGRDVIEVSTFRKAPAGNVKTNGNGVILRDNAYGTLDEDAFRRDFTVNALYYDPHEELILDYVGGIEDIKRRRLKFIGEARERLVEDPVRLLRAIRFQAKLGFALDTAITEDAAAITVRLQDIPSARLFDEFSKMFLTGYAANAWHLLERTPIAKALFPNTPAQDPLVPLAMLNTDRRIAIGRPVTAGFLLAVLLWADYGARVKALSSTGGMGLPEASLVAAHEALLAQRRIIALPRRHFGFITDIWRLQQLLEERRPRRVAKLLQHAKFRAAYDFLLLRTEAGLLDANLADWWTAVQKAPADCQAEMIAALKQPGGRRSGGKRRHRHR